MKIVVGVTDNRWAAFLRDHSDLTEANFWQPSPHGFVDPDPTIGCVILRNIFFAEAGHEIGEPAELVAEQRDERR